MLLALSGITGVGKSFYAEEIAKKLDFKKVHTIRTRTMRIGETKTEKLGLFMTHEEITKTRKMMGKLLTILMCLVVHMHIKKMKFYLMKIMCLKCIILLFKTGKE